MEEPMGFVLKLGVPGVLTLLIGIIYKIPIIGALNDEIKTVITILAGMLVGLMFLLYQGIPWSFASVIDYLIYGAAAGATAIGIFKVGQAVGVYSPPGK